MTLPHLTLTPFSSGPHSCASPTGPSVKAGQPLICGGHPKTTGDHLHREPLSLSHLSPTPKRPRSRGTSFQAHLPGATLGGPHLIPAWALLPASVLKGHLLLRPQLY